MKKLVLSTAILAVLSASTAQAALTIDGTTGLPTITPADTNILYLSGASAAEKFLEQVFTSASVPALDKICNTAKAIYKYQDTSAAAQFAYLCEAATTNPSVPTNKANILIYKRSAGGSAYGVSPIVADANGNVAASTIQFLKIGSNCTLTTAPVIPALGLVTCTYSATDAAFNQSRTPDFGISDVDPAQFKGNNSPINPDNGLPYADVTVSDVGLLTVKSASTLVFGVPVTKNLYFALQAAQISTGAIPASANCAVFSESEACMPSLSSAQIASIHAGAIVDWNQFKVGTAGLYDFINSKELTEPLVYALLPKAGTATPLNDGPSPSALHTCRRENGSGTQAQSNIKFLADPCTSAATATAPAPDTVAQGFGEGDGLAMIHENNASGNVDQCLNELQDGTNAVNTFDNTYGVRWAVGIQSLEKKTSAAGFKYRFVKVDGVSPTLENVIKGKYRDWAENTFQYSTAHVFSATTADNTALKALANAIIKSAGAPEVMGALNLAYTHTFTSAKGAYMAVPTAYAVEPLGALNTARPVNTYSHATPAAAVNNCRVPTVYNNGTAPSGDSGL